MKKGNRHTWKEWKNEGEIPIQEHGQ